jgi:hypothetical protein
MKLRQLGEDRLIERLQRVLSDDDQVLAGPGDDCAVVASACEGELLLLKTDCVVEGVHFSKRDSPAAVGWKAMMRPVSDFAAMSGLPRYALITLIAPPATEVKWTAQLYRGLEKAARQCDLHICDLLDHRVPPPAPGLSPGRRTPVLTYREDQFGGLFDDRIGLGFPAVRIDDPPVQGVGFSRAGQINRLGHV